MWNKNGGRQISGPLFKIQYPMKNPNKDKGLICPKCYTILQLCYIIPTFHLTKQTCFQIIIILHCMGVAICDS